MNPSDLAFFFAPQPCQDCRAVKPISELVPVVAPNGNLNGWKCRG
jgi:hypothetical protein